jgi:hypothetical protein
MDRAQPPKQDPAKTVDASTAPRKEEKVTTATGLDLLWEQALKKYEDDNHVTVDTKALAVAADKFGTAKNGIEKATLIFNESRHPHPEEVKAKFVTAVGGCLDWVDKAVGFVSDNVDGTVAKFLLIWSGCD